MENPFKVFGAEFKEHVIDALGDQLQEIEQRVELKIQVWFLRWVIGAAAILLAELDAKRIDAYGRIRQELE